MGKPAVSNYVASKHAINGLVKSASKEVGTLGITVNAVLIAKSRVMPPSLPNDARRNVRSRSMRADVIWKFWK